MSIEETRGHINIFINKLRKMDKKELAILKRNAGYTIGESHKALGIFYRILPLSLKRYEELCFLIATLYALNPRENSEDMGKTILKLNKICNNESMEQRFLNILDSEFDYIGSGSYGGGEMAFRLRQIISLASSKDIGINWEQLLEDLIYWQGNNDRFVQKRWAASYYEVALQSK